MPNIKNRLELADYFAELGFKRGAEVGVYRGEYSKVLLEAIPGLVLSMVDSWMREQRRVDAKELAIKNVEGHKAVLYHMTSLEAAQLIPDGSLDFVFIDAGHTYKEVKEDINAWTPKVRKGGIVSGHDYYEFPSGRGGVIPAVDEYVESHNIKLNVIPWDKSQSTDNRQPCWWFVR